MSSADANFKRHIARNDKVDKSPLALLAGILLLLELLSTWLLNISVFPTTSAVFPWARELQTFAGILFVVFVIICALSHPRLLSPGPMTALTLIFGEGGLLLLALLTNSPLAVSIGLISRSIGAAWSRCLAGMLYCQVGATRKMAISVTAALLAYVCLSTISPTPSYTVGLLLMGIALAFSLALGFSFTRNLGEKISRGEGIRNLALSNPQSYVRPTSQLFVLIGIFSGGFGFSLSLNIVDYMPVLDSSPLNFAQFIMLVIIAIWFLAAPSAPSQTSREDILFAISAILIVAGLLSAPISRFAQVGVPNALLNSGVVCFRILLVLSLAAICSRNASASLLVTGCFNLSAGTGVYIGADLGHLTNAFAQASPDATSIVTGLVVLLLFSYVLIGLRGFSFSKTINGIEPAVPVQAPDITTSTRDEFFIAVCTEIARASGLTNREREVLELLARGRNASHIQEELSISYNTAKTHIKRIYTKIDVHSQQELIDKIEQIAKY